MMSTNWIAVPPAALEGKGLTPYPTGEIGNLFDWAENPEAGSTHLMPHAGDFLLDIVDIEANAVHQPCKPGDEIVFVIAGTLRLTTDSDGSELSIPAGGMIFIPQGWAGVYRVDPGAGRFIEAAIVPADYFDAQVPRTTTGAMPAAIVPPDAIGRHELSFGGYRLVADNQAIARHRQLACERDVLIRVIAGNMLLRGSETESFGAGRFVVLPKGFHGEMEVDAEFKGFELILG